MLCTAGFQHGPGLTVKQVNPVKVLLDFQKLNALYSSISAWSRADSKIIYSSVTHISRPPHPLHYDIEVSRLCRQGEVTHVPSLVVGDLFIVLD